jgi:predicted N-formylglutamate amidohydrolase
MIDWAKAISNKLMMTFSVHYSRVIAALNKETWSDVSFETSEEISLLSSLLQMYDSCWEIKLRSLMKVFTHAVNRLKDPSVTEPGLLPCLKIIHSFIRLTQKGVSAPLLKLMDNSQYN